MEVANISNNASKYLKTYSSFSGSDMIAVFEFPTSPTKAVSRVIGSLQSITYSIHNEKIPVRSLGDMNMKNVVFGGRIIAGSMIFTVFNRHWLFDLVNDYRKAMNISNIHYLSDELPPLNITVSMANEYGQNARLSLYGVTFVNEGQVLSINDNYTENTFEYYAKDIDYLGSVGASNKKNTVKNNLKTATKEANTTKGTSTEVDNPKKDIKDIKNDKDNKDNKQNDQVKNYSEEYEKIFKETSSDIENTNKADYLAKLSKTYKEIFQDINTKSGTSNLKDGEYDAMLEAAKETYEKYRKEAEDYFSKQENKKADKNTKVDEGKKAEEGT